MSREIMRAVFQGDIAKFDSFLAKGLDVHTVTERENWNFLHSALVSVSLKPDLAMIQHLIDLGINVNGVDSFKNTPIHYAVRTKHTDIHISLIEMLLDAGAEINHENVDGVTPLRHMILSKPYDTGAFELLLSRGADLNHRVDDGLSVREFVERIGHGEDACLFDIVKRYS